MCMRVKPAGYILRVQYSAPFARAGKVETMQLHSLKQQAGTAFLGGAIRGLIETVGLEQFPRRLLGAAREVAGCDNIAAFAFNQDAPRLLFAETIDEAPVVARRLADCYLSFYMPRDPMWDAIADMPERDAFCAVELDADDMRYADDHADCLLRQHSRMSVSQTRGKHRLIVNFLRAGDFGADHRASILESVDLLMPLLWRHEAALWLRPEDPRAELRRRLAQRAPCLTARELDVCALIVAGLSSEGIALELGVSQNTVLTYRKRAYARLGISSQNELMRSILM
jgi:DNA-binding CsgD family transcriptional regulator